MRFSLSAKVKSKKLMLAPVMRSIALRTNSPIWVMEEVVADASIPVDRDADEAEQRAFRIPL